MSMTRRSVLRNFAALSAAPTLATIASPFLLGCKQHNAPLLAAPALDPNALYVLFEGPWIFSSSSSGQFVATTFTDGMHDCVYGNPDPQTGTLNTYQTVPPRAIWTGTLNPLGNRPSFDSIYSNLYNSQAGLNLVDLRHKGLLLNAAPTDISISLSMPDAVLVAGRLIDTKITDNASLSASTMQPYTTTVLKYTGKPALSLVDSSENPVVSLNVPNHLIFRMRHPTTECGYSSDHCHVESAFGSLVSRLLLNSKVPNLYLTATDVNYDSNGNADGLGDEELGLTRPKPPDICSGQFTPRNTTYANCAGGGIILGP